MIKKYIFFILVFSFTSLFSQQNKDFVEELSYVFDANQEFTLNNITAVNFKLLTHPRISYKNGTYWFKLLLKEEAKGKHLAFAIKEPSIQSVVVYANNQEVLSKKLELGNTHIAITIESNIELHYFLKVKFQRQVNFPLIVKEVSLSQNKIDNAIFFRGIYYGLALMVFLINIAFYISLKDVTFLYYAFFLATLNISFMGYDGVSYLFFEQEKIDFYLIVFHFLIQLMAAIFATHFLNLGNSFYKKNKLGIVALCISLIFYILFFITKNFLYCVIGDFIGLLILVYYWFLGVLRLKKEPFALFFVIGYSVFLLFGILFLIPINFEIGRAHV